MRDFKKVDVSEFLDFVASFQWKRRITEVHLHHTWRPRKIDDRGEATIQSMWRHHTQVNGWSDIAQHVTIGADGSIWLCRNFNWAPASASGFNGNSSAGPFMIEMIGDFDKGRETLGSKQQDAAVAVIKTVQKNFELPPEALRFHNEMSAKSCPGTSQDKAAWIMAITGATLPTPVQGARSAFAIHATRAADLAREMRNTSLQPDDMSKAEHDPGGTDGHEATLEARGLFDDVAPSIPLELADHAVNFTDGRFSNSGILSTGETDVDRLFLDKLPAEVAAAKAEGRPARLLLYAHGGLVSEDDAVRGAWEQLPFWQRNGIYPIFFIWETGLAETLKAMLLGATGAREAAARGVFDAFTDRAIEMAAHKIGRPIWNGMKRNAERAHDGQGAGTYFAKKLHEFIGKHGADVELHLIGHSAGSIFLTHFLQVLHPDIRISTAHFFAPAITNELFNTAFAPAVNGTRIGKLTVFTMTKARELQDTVTPFYRKSLLYLIRNGLELEKPTDILGLEESLRRDPATAKLFGLAGTSGNHAQVVWSVGKAGLCGHSEAVTHGGFDNDGPTLESACRIILGKCKGGDIVGYEPRRSRGASDMWDLDTLPGIPAVPGQPTAQIVQPVVAGSVKVYGGRKALCIGINSYRYITRLSGCVNDRNNWLNAFRGVGFDIHPAPEDGDATAEHLLAAIRSFVTSGSPGDQLVLQFAGHGTRFEDRSGDEKYDSCFCAADCNGDGPQGGLILDDEIYEILGTMQPGVRLTMFTDCCHSGTVSRAMIAPPTLPAPPDWTARYINPTDRMKAAYAAIAGQGKRHIMTDTGLRAVLFAACQDEELAWESGGSGNFTRIAVNELASARGLTNRQFHDRIIKAFGSDRRQTPNLYCRPEDLDAPFGIM